MNLFRKKLLASGLAVSLSLALPLSSFAAIKLSSRVKQAMLDSIETTIGTGAHIQIWAGTIPTDCATTAVGQTKLADFTLGSDWAAAASTTAGVTTKTFSSVPLTTTGLATGNAAFFRLTDSTNPSTSCDEQGSVTATGGGGDMTIDNVSITTGQTVNITGWTWTQPG
jgi:hypothetical protein